MNKLKYFWVFIRFNELPKEFVGTWVAVEYFFSERLLNFYYNNVWNEFIAFEEL